MRRATLALVAAAAAIAAGAAGIAAGRGAESPPETGVVAVRANLQYANASAGGREWC